MKKYFIKCFIGFMFLIFIAPQLKASEQDYEEVSYNELIQDLQKRARTNSRTGDNYGSDPFQNLRIHTSFGWLQSIHYLSLPSQSKARFREGIALGVGLDLFSDSWFAEFMIKNYGRSQQNDELMALREFDLRLTYTEVKRQAISFQITQGLGARYLKYSAPWLLQSYNESTPVYLIAGAVNTRLSKVISFGVELSATLALIPDSIDRQSLNLNFKLDNQF